MNLSLYVPDSHRPRLREIQNLARGAGLSISGEFMRFLETREDDLRRMCSERLSRIMGDDAPAVLIQETLDQDVRQKLAEATAVDPVETLDEISKATMTLLGFHRQDLPGVRTATAVKAAVEDSSDPVERYLKRHGT